MRYIITVFLVFLYFVSFSQADIVLSGFVVEQNSKYNTGEINYLSNVEIISVGAVPRLSDDNGRFSLIFADKPIGNSVKIIASKSGYELVNGEELNNSAVIGRKTPLKVVMCKKGQLQENQLAYYKIARDFLLEKYEEKIAILETKGNEQKILIEKMQIEFNQEINSVKEAKSLLENQKNKIEQNANFIAEKFIAVNLDDESESYQKAFQAFVGKNIDLALDILNKIDLENRLETNVKEKEKEKKLIEEYKESIINREKQIKQDINQCIFKAELHFLRYEFNEAQRHLEIALKFQPNDIELNLTYISLLTSMGKIDEAIFITKNILKRLKEQLSEMPNDEELIMNTANTFNAMGVLLDAENFDYEAEQHFNVALTYYSKLNSRELKTFDYSNLLSYISTTLNNYGGLLIKKDKLEAAQDSIEKSLELLNIICQENCTSEIIQADKAVSYSNLGMCLLKKGNSREAKLHLEKSNTLYRNLLKKDLDYSYLFSNSLLNTGLILQSENNFEEAIKLYQESYEICSKHSLSAPYLFKPIEAKILSNIGSIHYTKDSVRQAIKYTQDALELYKFLTIDSSSIYLPELGSTLMNLGIYYCYTFQSSPSNLDKGIKMLEESLEIFKVSAKNAPKSYKSWVCYNSIVLLSHYQIKLLLTGNELYKSKGIETSNDALSRITIYDQLENLDFMAFKKQIESFKSFFSDIDMEEVKKALKEIESQNKRQYKIESSKKDDEQSDALNFKEDSDLKIYIITQNTSLRLKPDSSSKVIRRMRVNEKIKVIEKTNKYWWKVNFNGKIGYVKKLLLKQK